MQGLERYLLVTEYSLMYLVTVSTNAGLVSGVHIFVQLTICPVLNIGPTFDRYTTVQTGKYGIKHPGTR